MEARHTLAEASADMQVVAHWPGSTAALAEGAFRILAEETRHTPAEEADRMMDSSAAFAGVAVGGIAEVGRWGLRSSYRISLR